jgi:integrase
LTQIAPGTTGRASWWKWFGRYIGEHGVTDTTKVFHSFRHAFTDALQVAAMGDEIIQSLLGWSGGGVSSRYGAKDKAVRFRHRLAEAVARVTYSGLDLSHLANYRALQDRRRAGETTVANERAKMRTEDV